MPESDLQDAEPDFRGMNLVAMTRWRSVIMNLIIRSPYYAAGKVGKVPVTFCQYLPEKYRERLFKPWALFKRQDLKIAVMV